MSEDNLGDRMKMYEGVEAKRRFDPALPIVARIDGRGFSKFTRDFVKPQDTRISDAMIATTMRLVEETHAAIGYVQSDEISLVWDGVEEGQSRFFDGRVQKLASVLAGISTSEFTLQMIAVEPQRVKDRRPVFDARVWQVPSQMEAANAILWRAQDAKKNGVSSAARVYMSHREMQGLNQGQMISVMGDRGVFYDHFSNHHKFGTFAQRRRVLKCLSQEEWHAIPPKHRPESLMVERSEVAVLPINYFGDVVDRVRTIFGDV